jgi:glycerol-1-phosphate dehydrogenase [NAD(P)+]
MSQVEFTDGVLQLEPFDCICGKRHELPIRRVIARPGAIADIVPELRELQLGTRTTLVCDQNTYDVAGKRVERDLIADGFSVTRCRFETRKPVKPDESAVGHVMLTMPVDTQFLVVCGSGCLTDLTRFVAARTGVPFVSVPTAPSMDGYAGSGAPMTHHGHKRTIIATHAQAVVADTDVLATAPTDMIASGFSDTIGKFTSRIDWELSKLVRDEYYCPVFVNDVSEMANRTADLAPAIRQADPDAIRTLTEALLVSGVAMLLIGNSRPASGSEHSLSHYWEMKAGLGAHREFFHGTKVGVATGVIAELNARFFSRDPATVDVKALAARPVSLHAVEEDLRRNLGSVAEGVIAEVSRPQHLNGDERRMQIERLVEAWPEIVRLAEFSRSREQIENMQRSVGAPTLPTEIDVDPDYLRETLKNAKEMRSRYTVLRAAETLGWLDELIDDVVEHYRSRA